MTKTTFPLALLNKGGYTTLKGNNSMTKIYLLRHGETNWNLERKMQGIQDIPLNDSGKEQATRCSKYFIDKDIEAIYSSPLSRAKETAQIIADTLNISQVNTDMGFIERDFGKASGLTFEEYHSYPDDYDFCIEDFTLSSIRIMNAIKSSLDSHPNSNILIVSHGAILCSAFYSISNGQIGSDMKLLKNCSISLIEYSDFQFNIDFYNRTPF